MTSCKASCSEGACPLFFNRCHCQLRLWSRRCGPTNRSAVGLYAWRALSQPLWAPTAEEFPGVRVLENHNPRHCLMPSTDCEACRITRKKDTPGGRRECGDDGRRGPRAVRDRQEIRHAARRALLAQSHAEQQLQRTPGRVEVRPLHRRLAATSDFIRRDDRRRSGDHSTLCDHPNSPMTGLPVENGGRMMPVFLPRSFRGTPNTWSTVAWRSCGVTGWLFGAAPVLSDSP